MSLPRGRSLLTLVLHIRTRQSCKRAERACSIAAVAQCKKVQPLCSEDVEEPMVLEGECCSACKKAVPKCGDAGVGSGLSLGNDRVADPFGDSDGIVGSSGTESGDGIDGSDDGAARRLLQADAAAEEGETAPGSGSAEAAEESSEMPPLPTSLAPPMAQSGAAPPPPTAACKNQQVCVTTAEGAQCRGKGHVQVQLRVAEREITSGDVASVAGAGVDTSDCDSLTVAVQEFVLRYCEQAANYARCEKLDYENRVA